MADCDDDPAVTGKEYEDDCRIDELICEGLEQVDCDAKLRAEHQVQFELECG